MPTDFTTHGFESATNYLYVQFNNFNKESFNSPSGSFFCILEKA